MVSMEVKGVRPASPGWVWEQYFDSIRAVSTVRHRPAGGGRELRTGEPTGGMVPGG
jgi:hypothetical protein